MKLLAESLYEFAKKRKPPTGSEHLDMPRDRDGDIIHPDLTKEVRTVGKKLEDLIKTADQYDLQGLKDHFLSIVNDPDTIISKHKQRWYESQILKQRNFDGMIRFLTNSYLRAANLGLNKLD